MYSEITIVVVAFNRPKSLLRILSSICNANYGKDSVRLVISIDKASNNNDVIDIANEFKWDFGEKIVNVQETNLGLKKHIIQCGDLTEKYGNIILLEDDLFVSKEFYNYSKDALNYYSDNNQIAGISLYSHRFNETAGLPFQPITDGYDNFFMQLPSSWGQLWTEKQWKQFKEWYIRNSENNTRINSNLPNNIKHWPDSSWKKYFTLYMIEENKFFVYPFTSYTTNFGDIGKHYWKTNTTLQVPINNVGKKHCFSNLEETDSIYDAYCENINLFKYLILESPDDILVDLYGSKKEYKNKRYIITTKILNYKIIKSYSMSLKPLEENIIRDISGDQVYIYDTFEKVIKGGLKDNENLHHQLEYYYPGMDIRKAFKLLFNLYTVKLIWKAIKVKILKAR
jgi:hypothetical protein